MFIWMTILMTIRWILEDSSNYCVNASYSGLSINISILNEDILKAIKKLKNNQVAGVDQVPSFIIKDCAYIFIEPLAYIFNLINQTSCFPSRWKDAKIIPVFKGGIPIYFHIKSVLNDSQQGFMKHRSTLTNMTYFSQSISEALENKSQIDVVYADYSKAFDKADNKCCHLSVQTIQQPDKLY
ncbi:uncharacterized protein LOC135142121 [Zophobas morio]|uniref:uncharacterized protein LOC135142121 n=1 Tax=Zophobas morio TaxID=2755281 RepID=UPI0030826CFC